MSVLPGHRAAQWLLLAGWVVLLALLPWWLGLVALAALACAAIYYAKRSASLADACGSALKWGLPGLLFAVQRALGGDLLAWGAALLGALVGFSLVALLESVLFHRQHPAVGQKPMPEWKDMAMAPVGPPGRIIELSVPVWQEAEGSQVDPLGQPFRFVPNGPHMGTYEFANGRHMDGLSARYTFGPGGRWFVANLARGTGDLIHDCHSGKSWRLQGWHLCGWEGEAPWFSRQTDGVPVPLHEALGQPAD